MPLSIGILGTFDVENFGDQLFPLIAERELQERLPDVEVRTYSPWGRELLTPLDGGHPAEELGAREPMRCAELAQELDCLLIGGGEIIHTRDELLGAVYGVTGEEVLARRPSDWFIDGLGAELEGVCPVIWHGVGLPFEPTAEEAVRLCAALEARPYITVRDATSMERLRRAGVTGPVNVVPDSAFMVNRLLPTQLLVKRREFHRHMGWVPAADEPVLVVQGNRDLVRFAPQIAASLRIWLSGHPDVRVVIAELGPCHGDSEFADALAPMLPRPVFRFPRTAGIADTLSLIEGAHCFMGISLHGSITSVALGRRHVILNLNEQSKLDGFAQMIDAEDRIARRTDEIVARLETAWLSAPAYDVITLMQARLDQHFDHIAEIAEKSAAQRPGRVPDREELLRKVELLSREVELLRRASGLTARRLIEERSAMAEPFQAVRGELAQANEELAQANQALLELQNLRDDSDALQAAQRQHELLLATKTFRYTSRPRSYYAKIRRMFE
jgi:polysaccharide pyruvyl transferase WcaK-like protein